MEVNGHAFCRAYSFDDYHPHMIISYVKAGTGAKYIKELKTPIEFSCSIFEYKWTDVIGSRKSIKFNK